LDPVYVLYASLGFAWFVLFRLLPTVIMSLSLRRGAVAVEQEEGEDNYATLRSDIAKIVSQTIRVALLKLFCLRWACSLLSVTVILSGNRLNAFFSSFTVNMQSLSGTLPRQHPVVSMSGLSLIPQPSYICGPSTMMGHPTLRRQSSHDMDQNMPRILSRNAANVQYYYG
jgi:hypothetical protein